MENHVAALNASDQMVFPRLGVKFCTHLNRLLMTHATKPLFFFAERLRRAKGWPSALPLMPLFTWPLLFLSEPLDTAMASMRNDLGYR